MATQFLRLTKFRFSILVFVAAFLVLATDIGVPAFWSDEIATISAANRPISGLMNLSKHVDAVHSFFYLVMHFWIHVAGISKLSLRLPSVFALALAASLLFVILFKRTNLYSSILATSFFVGLPRVVWAATIVRSYAWTALIGLVLTWLLLRIMESATPSSWWFASYMALAVIGEWLFLYTSLLVASQLIGFLLTNQAWSKRFKFILASGCALLAALPLAIVAKLQIHQIAWLPSVREDLLGNFFSNTLFMNQGLVALVSWLLVLAGLVLAFRTRQKSRFGESRTRDMALVLIISSLLPTTLVIGYSIFNKSIFDARYFTYSAPVFAMMLGMSLWLIRPKWIGIVASIFAVALLIPRDLQLRQPDTFGNDLDQVTEIISDEAKPGDAALFAPSNPNAIEASRASIGYPNNLKKVDVIGLKNQMVRFGELIDHPRSFTETLKQAKKYSRLWFIRNLPGISHYEKQLQNGIAGLGFKPVKSFKLHYDTVTLFQR